MLSGDIERKVRALLERANHPGTPPAEAEAALAMAYRLMMKYDLDIRSLGESGTATSNSAQSRSTAVERRRYETTGPYRVRRYILRYDITDALSCSMFRATREEDTDTVVCYGFGTANDLDGAEALYAAAEMLALRTIPWGDRGYRTAWWHGFTAGLREKLCKERRKIEHSRHGAEVVLREREERAREEMLKFEPNLVWRRHGSSSSADAFAAGRRAGSRFSSGQRDVGSTSLALPPGA